jgi:hypothetical protein
MKIVISVLIALALNFVQSAQADSGPLICGCINFGDLAKTVSNDCKATRPPPPGLSSPADPLNPYLEAAADWEGCGGHCQIIVRGGSGGTVSCSWVRNGKPRSIDPIAETTETSEE